MNKKLKMLLETKCVCVCAILDAYNQKVVKDIAPTITTRVSASNEIYVVVADEHKKKDM